METRIDDGLVARRSPALLAGIFAGAALLLAAIGTYGVLSYAVAQRTREIGIRMALGAQRKQIATQFLSLGLRLLAVGTILGLIGASMAGRAMRTVLFGVPALPVGTLLGTTLFLSAVSVVACLIPARRATKVDPMIALRAE
jgi:ABC-type antimicrobial peptide transport system permease subunit